MLPGGSEPRRDPREFDRRAQERLAQRAAVLAVVHGLAAGIGVAECGEAFAAVDERRGDDVAVAQALALAVEVVVDHGEAVALAQVLGKVDVVAERIGELDDHRVVHAGLRAGIEQRGFDDAVGDMGAALDQTIDDALVRAVRVEGHDDPASVVAVEAQAGQLALGVVTKREFVAGMDVAQGAGVGVVVQQFLQNRRTDAVLLEDFGNGLPGMHGYDGPAVVFGIGRIAGILGADDIRVELRNRQLECHDRRIGLARRVGAAARDYRPDHDNGCAEDPGGNPVAPPPR